MSTSAPELQAVPELDLTRYAGKWYEIARLPTRFEEDCARNVTATYTVEENGEISVLNECVTEEGEKKSATGTARLAEETGPNSKLKVSFVTPFLHFLPFVWADYWVIDLDPEYRFAAVGEPDRKYFWILSRTPQMDTATYERILGRVASQGYEVSNMIQTVQSHSAVA